MLVIRFEMFLFGVGKMVAEKKYLKIFFLYLYYYYYFPLIYSKIYMVSDGYTFIT